MTPQDFTEQIEDFLLDQLNETERKAFESALAKDQTLQEEVAFRKLIIKGTKRFGRDELKDHLKQMHQEFEPPIKKEEPAVERKLWPKMLGIAASIALLIISGLFLFDNDELTPQAAYEQYYQAASLRLASRDLDAEKMTLQLNELYNDKKYKTALPLFEKLLMIDSTNAQLRLGAGICHLELEQLDAARTQFLTIIEAKDFRLQHQANWYMALTYLKTGNVEAAQKYLNLIVVNSKADHHEEAMELMERLKSS